MKQVVRALSAYSADLYGINSVLYELGGLIVMHDASGCNSTYNTHDEPRWYDIDSMIYISGLRENDVILGNDERLIDDICEAALETHPNFIAITAALIPLFMSTDMKGIAKIIEKRTGIPTFGFTTNAMDTYINGGNMAYSALLGRFCPDLKTAYIGRNSYAQIAESSVEVAKTKDDIVMSSVSDKNAVSSNQCAERADKGSGCSCKCAGLSVNLLGITPLDFSVNGNREALINYFTENGICLNACMTMGCTLDDIKQAASADVNILCSSLAEDGAELLKKKYGTPYITGIPIGRYLRKNFLNFICAAGRSGNSKTITELSPEHEYPHKTLTDDNSHDETEKNSVAACDNKKNIISSGKTNSSKTITFYHEYEHLSESSPGHSAGQIHHNNIKSVWIIGEPVFAASLRLCLENDFGFSNVHIICPTERDCGLLREHDVITREEENIEKLLKNASLVIGDPIYRRVLPKGWRDRNVNFIDIPHEAYSGRMYRSHIPVFTGANFTEWLEDRISSRHDIGINDIMLANEPFRRG